MVGWQKSQAVPGGTGTDEDSAGPAGEAANGAGTAGALVVPMHYASAEDLAKILQPYVGDGGKIAADPGPNALLVAGEPQAREGLIGLIQAFDVDVLARQSYAL